MATVHTTPLAKLYQDLVDAGTIVPNPEPARFTFPSMRVYVPSVTTYGTHDLRGLEEETRAQLEPGTQRNSR